MSAPGAGTDEQVDDEGVAVRSPYRPVPLGARKALAEYSIVRDLDPSDGQGRGGGVVLEERLPASLLDQWELVVEEEPAEVWRGPAGSRVEIYDGRVEIGGREASLSPAEAKVAARDREGFERVDCD